MSTLRFPVAVTYLYRSALFRLNCSRPSLCLTFDDGPHPSSTPGILGILEKYSIRSVFFCTGENALLYPEMMGRIRNAGHITGNHSFSHYDGFFTATGKYLDDVEKASGLTSSSLFRPPYGRMRWKQYLNLRKKYSIMMWDLMAEDYSQRVEGKDITAKLMGKLRHGSIITFHDRPDCLAKNCLEGFINEAFSRGYDFVLP